MLKELLIHLIASTSILSQNSAPDQYNTSICSTFELSGVYYKLNSPQQSASYGSWWALTDQNINTRQYIFNYCNQVQYYCPDNYRIVYGSLIYKDSCKAYTQSQIGLIDQNNISSGLKIVYEYAPDEEQEDERDTNQTVLLEITISYACNSSNLQIWSPGCPQVQSSTVFHYFNENQLGFTITILVIGILFMVLGVYIYRVTIVLIAGLTVFLILIAIQSTIIFRAGAPTSFINVIIIINGVISLLTGYVFGYFPKVGLFFLGAWIGLIISLTLNNIAFYFIISNPANLALWITMPILCLLFGILSLFIKKTFIIFATSLIGAYVSLRALSWHLGTFPNEFLISRKYQYGLEGPVEWQFYLYVIALIILTASSSGLQYWLFKKKLGLGKEQIDIDDHFEGIEKKMQSKRQNLVAFQNIFKGKKSSRNGPKRLKRQRNSNSLNDSESESGQEDSQQSQDYNEQDEYELPDVPQEKGKINKLTQKLLSKKK